MAKDQDVKNDKIIEELNNGISRFPINNDEKEEELILQNYHYIF